MSAGDRLCTLQENPHFWVPTIEVRPPDGNYDYLNSLRILMQNRPDLRRTKSWSSALQIEAWLIFRAGGVEDERGLPVYQVRIFYSLNSLHWHAEDSRPRFVFNPLCYAPQMRNDSRREEQIRRLVLSCHIQVMLLRRRVNVKWPALEMHAWDWILCESLKARVKH